MADLITIFSVVGARPQFIKLAPIVHALQRTGVVNHQILHTGQHYDENMSSVFFDELDIPRPDVDLGVGSGSHAVQTAAMMVKLEEVYQRERPDAVLVYGDTNSTLAAALAAAKIHIPIAHVEAGLRSFNRDMPEEINRIVTDHCSDRLYVPTVTGMRNLKNENLLERSVLTGDVMRDVVENNRKQAESKSRILEEHKLCPDGFGLLTLHRPVNTTAEALRHLLATLDRNARAHKITMVLPVHPRTLAILNSMTLTDFRAIRFIEPLAYLDMIRLVGAARVVVTDSGGLQKEAAFLGTYCITVREETEWTETVEMGINVLVGTDADQINAAFDKVMSNAGPFAATVFQELDKQYGVGDAATVIAQDLLTWLNGKDCRKL